MVEDGGAGKPEVEVYDARDLFDQAGAALDGESWDQALALYDRLVSEFPGSALVVPALFNAGLAHEGKGDAEGAIARYQQVARIARPRDVIDASIRIAAVLAEKGAWARSAAALEPVLASKAASADDRREALARRGYALVEQKSYAEAERSLRAAIELAGKGDRADYFAAMAHFYLAEIPRRQAAAVPLRLPDAQLKADLEAKARLVLLAQERFQAAVGLGNVLWATAAGHQMAAMQEEMWRALVSAPVPGQLKPDEAAIYVAEVRKLARPYLDRALDIHGKNVALAERYRTESPWSEGSRQRIPVLADLIARENRGERPGPGDALAGP
ncbi:MAG TPA: tetratricopeptide repeat protein, partial [Kofleriaceae bacterium]|nr:tetratricopeptide repeat protein [Kofleriaceae bacterium]